MAQQPSATDDVSDLSIAQMIEQFRMEPTAALPMDDTAETVTQLNIPSNTADAVQFQSRPMFSSSYNPMHERRRKAIQAIYQFLSEENLHSTLQELQNETRIVCDPQSLSQSGVLLESLDLRDAYYSAQTKSSSDTESYLETLRVNAKQDEAPCTQLLYQFHGIHASNILCIDAFYHQHAMHIISGVATRSLLVLSCQNIFNAASCDAEEYDLHSDAHDVDNCKSRIVSQLHGLNGPPLYIAIDPKHRRYALVTCMDGSVYIIDAYSTILTPDRWQYTAVTHHTKYVTVGRWSHSSEYFLTAGHDNKSTLYKFDLNDDDGNEQKMAHENDACPFTVSKLHQYAYGACVESIAWISDIEFIISVRNSNFLEYFKIDAAMDKQASAGTYSYLLPFLKCNMNAFGGNHVSFQIGDMHMSKDGNFLLCKTDREKVMLMLTRSEETLKTYYGSHSDVYSYSRCCFSGQEKFVYASHHNDFVIWDVATGKLLYRQRNAHNKTLRDLCVDRKHGVIITASFDRTIKIWSP